MLIIFFNRYYLYIKHRQNCISHGQYHYTVVIQVNSKMHKLKYSKPAEVLIVYNIGKTNLPMQVCNIHINYYFTKT